MLAKVQDGSNAMLALYDLLSNKPEKGRWIKRLSLDLPGYVYPPFFVPLLQLALTSSVVSISGQLGNATFLDEIASIIKRSPKEFRGLKEMTIWSFHFGTQALALVVKDTVQKLHCSEEDISLVPSLQGFSQLTSLVLSFPVTDVASLRLILKVSTLQKLHVVIGEQANNQEDPLQMVRGVEQGHASLKVLKVDTAPRWSVELLQYLMARLHNLSRAEVSAWIHSPSDYQVLKHVVKLVNDVPSKQLTCMRKPFEAITKDLRELLGIQQQAIIEKTGSCI
ncbi:hypothetical protein MBANPS3_001145 [Mucor bainieri]